MLFEITIRDRDGAVVDRVRTQAERYTARRRLDPAGGPFTWEVVALGWDDGAPVLRRSAERAFDVVAPPAATASEPVILDPPAGARDFLVRWTSVAGAATYDIVTTWADGDNDTSTNAEALPYTELVHAGPGVSGPDRWSSEPAAHTYRVIAYDASGVELVRGPPRSLPAPLPPAPALVGPVACGTATCGTPASPTFRWEPVPGAIYYQVDHQSAGPTPATTGTSARAFYPRPSDTEALTWRVRAIGTAGPGPWSATRSYWWSRVYPEPVGPAEGSTVEDEATVRYTGGTPPPAPPGAEPPWTVQEERLVNRPSESYVASVEPHVVSWGLVDDGAPRRTFTIRQSTPALIEPADGAVVDALPLLRWAPQPWVRGYAVEIHRGGPEALGPATLLATIGTRDASALPPEGLAPGTYRWRVRRTELVGYPEAPMPGSPSSEARTFSVPEVPGPRLTGPADGSVLRPTDMLLAWEPVAGASAYRVELSRDPAFAVLGYTASSAAPGWAPGAPLSGGDWYWRVQAVGLGDTVIGTSAGRAFTLDAPLQKPPTGQLVVGGGLAYVAWPTTSVTFPTAAFVGARRVRLSNDMVTWRTYAWRPTDYTWDLAPGAASSQPGSTTAPSGPYTVYGQWEDLDGNWSAVASDTVVFDNIDPTASVILDGGAATTTRRFVELDLRVADNDLVGPTRVCGGVGCAILAGVVGPITWPIADPGDPPGSRQVCAGPLDIARNDAAGACASIDLVEPATDGGGAATDAGPPATVPLRIEPSSLALTHVRAGDEIELSPFTAPGGLPAGTATCTWRAPLGRPRGAARRSSQRLRRRRDDERERRRGLLRQLATSHSVRRRRALHARLWRHAPRTAGSSRRPPPTGRAARAVRAGRPHLPARDHRVEPPARRAQRGRAGRARRVPHVFGDTSGVPSHGRGSRGTLAGRHDGNLGRWSLALRDRAGRGRWSVRWAGLRGGNLVTAYLDPTAGMLDAVAPRTTTPTVRPTEGRSVGSTVADVVSWAGTDVGGGIARYEVQVSRNGGAWSAIRLASATSRSAAVSLATTVTYRYRVRAVDQAGNPGSWAAGPSIRPTLLSERSATYRGTWYRTSWSGYLGGAVRWATARGASATYTFRGSAIGWISRTGPTRGRATVYVDGKSAGTIDLRAATYGNRRLVFSRAWPAVGRHTIKIVVAGTSGRPRVDVDGFVVLR